MPSPAEMKKSISFEEWFNQDGPLQRLIKAKDPTTEPLAPALKTEPDTWWGGFAKGLYDEFVRPATSLTGIAGLVGGGEAGAEVAAERLPAGLSKTEFANLLRSNPEMLDRLMAKMRDQSGKVEFSIQPEGRLGQLIQRGQKGYEFTANALKNMEQAIRAGEGLDKLWEPLNKYLSAFQDDPNAATTFARMWGATSPNTPVARNNYEALQAWKQLLKGEIPFTAQSARGADITMAPAKVPNLNRAIRGEAVQGGRGEIGKTENMAQLIATGAKDAIPIDVHALSGVGATEDAISKTYSGIREMLGSKRGQHSATDLYNVAKEAYMNGLEKFGAPFAQMWEGVKTLKGQGQSAGMTSWLKKWGLLEPGAMVDEAALNHVIENVDRAEFYGQQLKNTELAEPKPYSRMLEKHSELGSQPQQVDRIADIVRGLTEKNQGTTYNITGGDLAHAKTPTYAVAAFPERSVTYKNAPNNEQLRDFITKNIDLLKDPTNSIGTWWDKDANEFVLDISKTIPDREAALALGKQFKQKAIFDLHKMEEIPVAQDLEQQVQKMVKLYRGESGAATAGDKAGRYFTDDPLTALYYSKRGGDAGRMFSIELPEAEAAKYRDLTSAEKGAHLLPEELAQKARGNQVGAKKSLEDVANSYAQKKGLDVPKAHEPVKVNKEFAKNVAQAYDVMKHAPNDPAVKKAYGALASEIEDQFEHITKEGGLKVEAWTKKGQPYADSKAMMADVEKNNHLYYFPTEAGFGSSEVADHPLLAKGKNGMVFNDMLRIVHDYLAHAKGKFSFGPNGEENAFIEHTKLLSPEARKALATETRGQNSWVNFGPHSDLPVTERPFAPQKAGLLPDELQEPFPFKKRTPPSMKAPMPTETRLEELLKKLGGLSQED